MRVGDLVMFESDVLKPQRFWTGEYVRMGVVIAKLPSDGILAHAVSVMWASGELVERCPPRILEVISEAR